MHEELARGLDLVVANGAPAQQAEARRLLAALDASPDDAGALAAAGQLVDAYLHDPYLERE